MVQDIITKFGEHTGRHLSAGAIPTIEYLEGGLEHTDLITLYDLSDVVVHPSRSEGWGLGVAEAMARSKAVVMPDYGSSNEFTPDHLAYKYPAFRCASRARVRSPSVTPTLPRAQGGVHHGGGVGQQRSPFQ